MGHILWSVLLKFVVSFCILLEQKGIASLVKWSDMVDLWAFYGIQFKADPFSALTMTYWCFYLEQEVSQQPSWILHLFPLESILSSLLSGLSWNRQFFIWVQISSWHWDIFVMVLVASGKKKIQNWLSPHFCWLWKPCCFSTSISSKANRKDPCRKWRHFRKWTNYPPSVYGSCWKVWLKVLQCFTVYSTLALLFWYDCFWESVLNPIGVLYFFLRFITIKREHLVRAHVIFSDASPNAEIFFLFYSLGARNICCKRKRQIFLSLHFSSWNFMYLIRPSRGRKTFAVCCSTMHIGVLLLLYLLHISCYTEEHWSPIYQKKERKKQMWEGISELLSASERLWRYILFI